ncbi:PREDICTED: interleukin-12 receptor subunit beta-1 [Pygoscelis adeliae]|uniref:interleukin-12 receptor subunit beta-1 n=1 Tax=Pygoscelis adeliae TaxID=9238 RepID=UPI0004F5007D|nr:PREDICTED: interleukin-12 receptor subunit beta-1 [Pygoscelis adeliae]
MLGWLLAVLVALARGGTAATPGFSCWKQCSSRWFLCSWPPSGPDGNTSYLLKLCYEMPRLCRWFEAGRETTYTLKHHHVYVLTNATAWVEARWGDHVHRTPNLTLYLDEAIKPDPPPVGMPFTKTGGKLRLQGPCRPLSLPQRAPKEQGDVAYTLRVRMLACHCTELAEEDTVVLGREVTVHNLTLSGAEYEILLMAANAAGTGPARQLHVPAEQRADLGFKDVSVAGGTMMGRFSPAELLITEPNPGKETTDAGTWPSTPQPGPATEKPVVVCLPGCEKELPFAYRRQEVLSLAGFPPPGSTGCPGHPAVFPCAQKLSLPSLARPPLREKAAIPVEPAGKALAQGCRDFACGFRGRERLRQTGG